MTTILEQPTHETSLPGGVFLCTECQISEPMVLREGIGSAAQVLEMPGGGVPDAHVSQSNS